MYKAYVREDKFNGTKADVTAYVYAYNAMANLFGALTSSLWPWADILALSLHPEAKYRRLPDALFFDRHSFF